ncbi:hypothetical protein KJN74_05430 [Candidatus Bathyarchaeota archaeon]|nr:hypothetical protein [Candidatus Bathyarchaeota archaeon]
MNSKKISLIFLTILMLIALTNVAFASLTTLETGFAVTSNKTGPISQGNPITITARTLDPYVEIITIQWYGPGENSEVYHEDNFVVFTNGTMGQYSDGTTAEVKYAQSTYSPNIHGEWNVKVIFHNARGGNNVADFSLPLDIQQNMPVFVVPETPLGTIGIITAIALALGLFSFKNKKQK